MRRDRYIPLVPVRRYEVSANEGYAIKLRQERAQLEVDRRQLLKVERGQGDDLFGRTVAKLKADIALRERRVNIMALY